MRSFRDFRVAWMQVCLGILVAAATFGQVASRIRGTVRDASQAVMPGVKVTVVDVNRGSTLITTTNEVGQFSFPNMLVDAWQINAEIPMDVTPGPAVPLQITAGGVASNTVTIAVQ